jgi:hypothetical protein
VSKTVDWFLNITVHLKCCVIRCVWSLISGN